MSTRDLYTHAQLRRLFHPRTIAVVGATPNARSFAGRAMANLQQFDGKVLLVNPRYPEVNGQVCYPSLSALPEAPDCVLIATDHSAYDYDFVVRHAPLVVDTRNATKNVRLGREKIRKA